MIGLQIKLLETHEVEGLPVPLRILRDSGNLLDPNTKKVFATLDQTGTKILDVLQREISIELFADRNPLRSDRSGKKNMRPNSKIKQSPLIAPIELHAILYGPATLFELVGAFAAFCQLHLQHPKHCSRNVPYRNPHCLSIEDDQTMYTLELESILGAERRSMFETPANPIDLFADSTEQDALSDADPPRAIKTELYRHQKQALTFMIQRESGWAMDGNRRDIWKEVHEASARVLYQNTITGAKRTRRPDEFRGGLLIDAPGLGKTLSIIALLTFDLQSQSPSQSQDLPQEPSSSITLLVVPKTCES